MRYIGGKGRIARAIVDVIRLRSPYATLAVEPFMGGAAVTARLAERFDRVSASDAHRDVAMLWAAVVDGWMPPDTITEKEYAELRNAESSALRGLAGFGGSFGGKWFGGYARGGHNADGTPRDHQAESARAVARIGRSLRAGNVEIRHQDYRDVTVTPGAVVYCDPPYNSTQGYSVEFSSAEFWTWAESASQIADVYVSEYAAPDGWESIWSAEKRQSITMPAQGREIRREQLWKRVD